MRRHTLVVAFPESRHWGPVMAFLMFALVSLGADDPSEINRLIARHDDGLAKIHSIRATIEGRISNDGGQTWTPKLTMECRRSGERERLHIRDFGIVVDGEWREETNLSDYAYSSAEMRSLGGLDPDHPPRLPLSGEDVSQIKGNILPAVSLGAHGYANAWTLALLFVPDVRYSLRDLSAASKNKSLKHVDIEGVGEAWDVGLNAPDGKCSYTVSLIPGKSYAIGKLVTRYRDPNSAQAKAVTYTRTVLEYLEAQPGLFLPRVIRSTESTNPKKISEVTLKSVVMNQPIPEAELTLEFPPGAMVYDYARKTYHLWGDGEPARTFVSNEEFGAWNRERTQALMASPRASSSKWWWVAGFLAATVFLIGLILLRRKLIRKVAA